MISCCLFTIVLFVLLHTKSIAQPFVKLMPQSSGIVFRNDITESDSMNILSDFYIYNGGGVAVGDIDNDGFEDIIFSATNGNLTVYKNMNGTTFLDITTKCHLENVSKNTTCGIALFDLTADGILDLYVSHRDTKNQFFRGTTEGVFIEEAEQRGLDIALPTTSANVLDYDRDGNVDVFLVVSGEPRKHGYMNPGLQDILLRNKGNGYFENVTEKAGLKDKGYGLSASIGDVNNDGWPDIFVANDFEERDQLWLNNMNGTFTNIASTALRATSWSSMGSDIADINNDGWLDIATNEMLPENHQRRMSQIGGVSIYGPFFDSTQRVHNFLHLNQGDGLFTDISFMAGVAATDWSWAVLMADFNGDAWQDIVVTNGTKRDVGDQDFAYNLFYNTKREETTGAYKKMPSTRMPNYFFQGSSSLLYKNISRISGFGDSVISNGAAYADFNNDGYLDIVVNNTDTVASVYINHCGDTAKKLSYLYVVPRAEGNNPFAYGTRLTVYPKQDSNKNSNKNSIHKIIREIYPTRGFHSSVSTKMLIPLGQISAVDSLVITWPNGTTNTYPNPELNTLLEIRQQSVQPFVAAQQTQLLNEESLTFKHKENIFDDFKRERLLPFRGSKCGPAVATADVNGDGLQDVIFSGAKFSPCELYLQTANATFKKSQQSALESTSKTETIAIAFVDVDADKDMDIVCVTGGCEFLQNDPELADKVFLNDGKGNFTESAAQLPTKYTSGSCIAVADINSDKKQDIFIGGRAIPGKYPYAERSTLMINNKGEFIDVTDKDAKGLATCGIVNAATFVDIDKDGDSDLFVAREWNSPQLWKNTGGIFTDVSAEWGLDTLQGVWLSVLAVDINNDGFPEVILGSMGLNTLYQPTQESPLQLIVADYDDNGSIDPLVTYKSDGEYYSTRTRSVLYTHMPTLTRTFPTYQQFASSPVKKLLSGFTFSHVDTLYCSTQAHVILRNTGTHFTVERLPNETQLAPVYAIATTDINADGLPDLLLAGNMRSADADVVAYDAGVGCVLLNNGTDGFQPVMASKSGFILPEEVRSLVPISLANSKNGIIAGCNDSQAKLITVNAKNR